MIEVKFTEKITEKTIKRRLDVVGHADGNDHTAICSAASMMMQSLALFLTKRYPYEMDAHMDEGRSFVECENYIGDLTASAVWTMTEEGYHSLYNRYPKDILIL